MHKTIIFTVYLLLLALLGFSQNDSINPNGYNIFYYPNGFKLSEGKLVNGKPDGYWITYYVNGQKKSEGNRKNFLLDSMWIFYAENGDTLEKIYYVKNKKNGFDIKYFTRFDTGGKNTIKSKELYVDGKKQGFSFYYYPNGKIHYKIKYKDNYKHGTALEYSEQGQLIAIEQYRNDNLISRRAVNRTDRNGKKTGEWVQVFDDGRIKTEINYVQGLPNGTFKEFSPTGQLLKMERYQNGKLISKIDERDTLSVKKLRTVLEYYPNGKLKAIKVYKDSILYGMQIFCDKDGKYVRAEIYDKVGNLKEKGPIDSQKRKQGKWTLFFENGLIAAVGEYKDGKKQGKWIYYCDDGKKFEEGYYTQGITDGKWIWFYPNGNILKVETYSIGVRDGNTYELSIKGDTVVRGNYTEDVRDGKWYFTIGDEHTEGEYYLGAKTGMWITYYFPEMKIKCKTMYRDGKRNGKHKCFYLNKRIKETGQFFNDKKNGVWFYYNEDGTLDFKAEYAADRFIKINDIPIK